MAVFLQKRTKKAIYDTSLKDRPKKVHSISTSYGGFNAHSEAEEGGAIRVM